MGTIMKVTHLIVLFHLRYTFSMSAVHLLSGTDLMSAFHVFLRKNVPFRLTLYFMWLKNIRLHKMAGMPSERSHRTFGSR